MESPRRTVYKTRSVLRVPRTELEGFLRNPDSSNISIPDKIDSFKWKLINNTFKITSVPCDSVSVGKYVPTASLKGYLQECVIVVEDDGTISHKPPQKYENKSTFGLSEENELNTQTIEYVEFNGYGDDVIVGTQLRGEVFDFLCELSQLAVKGFVSGVRVQDDELVPIRYNHQHERQDVSLFVEEKSANDGYNKSPTTERDTTLENDDPPSQPNRVEL